MHPAPRRTTEASHELLLEHYPLARKIAARMARRLPPGFDVDELVSVAVIGLMEACERFDPSRGVSFSTFAKHRMHGAILDSLRAADWVPRSVRTRVGAVDRTAASLRDELGRLPTSEEIAERMGVDVVQVRSARSEDTRPVLSLDAPIGSDERDGASLMDRLETDDLRADDRLVDQELQDLAVAAVADLPDRERYAVEQFYLLGAPLKQIGAELGVSESRACQLCRQGTRRLRAQLAHVME